MRVDSRSVVFTSAHPQLDEIIQQANKVRAASGLGHLWSQIPAFPRLHQDKHPYVNKYDATQHALAVMKSVLGSDFIDYLGQLHAAKGPDVDRESLAEADLLLLQVVDAVDVLENTRKPQNVLADAFKTKPFPRRGSMRYARHLLVAAIFDGEKNLALRSPTVTSLASALERLNQSFSDGGAQAIFKGIAELPDCDLLLKSARSTMTETGVIKNGSDFAAGLVGDVLPSPADTSP